MPKVPKIRVLDRFYEYITAVLTAEFISFFLGPDIKDQKKTERSDTLILGTLDILDHFGHFLKLWIHEIYQTL